MEVPQGQDSVAVPVIYHLLRNVDCVESFIMTYDQIVRTMSIDNIWKFCQGTLRESKGECRLEAFGVQEAIALKLRLNMKEKDPLTKVHIQNAPMYDYGLEPRIDVGCTMDYKCLFNALKDGNMLKDLMLSGNAVMKQMTPSELAEILDSCTNLENICLRPIRTVHLNSLLRSSVLSKLKRLSVIISGEIAVDKFLKQVYHLQELYLTADEFCFADMDKMIRESWEQQANLEVVVLNGYYPGRTDYYGWGVLRDRYSFPKLEILRVNGKLLKLDK